LGVKFRLPKWVVVLILTASIVAAIVAVPSVRGSVLRGYRPLGRKAMLRRIGLRGLDPALFERSKSGFVLPFDRWIRCGLKAAMDQTLRDPQAIVPTGLNPEAVGRLWRAFRDGHPASIGRESGRFTCSFGGATAIASFDETARPDGLLS
jgi:hypothetical protein